MTITLINPNIVMSILTTENLGKSYGADEIFNGLSLNIPKGSKIALVGANGVGKTTLLEVLIGKELATEGTVNLTKNVRVGFLPQNPALNGNQTIHDEMLKAFEGVLKQKLELETLEHQLNDAGDELLDRYGKLQQAFELAGGYDYELEIERVLQGLGFRKADYDHPLGQLSGGQKTRTLLARLLLEKPDLLVLDEPTNHLDINAIEWLEGYLQQFDGAVLMVSHDRYFMDNVTKTIWELDWGGVEPYRGNYSHYLQQRAERHDLRQKEFESQQAYIAKEMDYIRKHMGSQNTAQAKGKLRRLERLMSGTDRNGRALDKQWLKKPPRRRQTLRVNFTASSRTGDHVLRTQNLSVGYQDPLFEVPDLLLQRGEVAAIIGANGSGKTTFMKTILGQLEAIQGDYTWGAQVDIGYFAQAHEDLKIENTLLDELLTIKNIPVSEARNYLANYLFTGDDVFRKVSTLSGGERGRLALAKLALDGANVLLLDEPTNHLDIASQEVLQDMLAAFGGTILLISHDRYIVDALASQIWHVTGDELTVFEGGYAEYQQMRKATQVETSIANQQIPPKDTKTETKTSEKKHGLNPYQLQKRLTQLEAQIETLEATFENITKALEVASAAGDVDEVNRLGAEYTSTETDLNAAIEEWTTLAD